MERPEGVSMERSEGVSVALDHIMKMMDRSGERLLRSFRRFEGSEIGLGRAGPRAPKPAVHGVASKAGGPFCGGRSLVVPGFIPVRSNYAAQRSPISTKPGRSWE
jgi:hypothetical protein